MFTAAPPAGPADASDKDQQQHGVPAGMVTADAGGKAGVDTTAQGIDPGHVFTAAEQVAAAVMAGAAGSSCPANPQDAERAAVARDGAVEMDMD